MSGRPSSRLMNPQPLSRSHLETLPVSLRTGEATAVLLPLEARLAAIACASCLS
eukprot:CAMPEP_0119340294 /NCGR_PEP_ID=MMETSP1333-20130426/100046_1 /TAXON_ID=418940 /ORGANISM="Scyphosphaera apsteinii, Strain RCC1455" /LENGTH=53 /DNA_ID=CAMNT_0007352017 /DNA_START=47 /DNA_END=205 /DNA_ORIENTATION=-